MFLYYFRHGDPIYVPDSLTELGHEQAKALVKRTSYKGLDKIFSSPSIRAQMTAEPTCKELGLEKIIVDWANEGTAWQEFSVTNSEGKGCWIWQSGLHRDMLNHPEVRKLDTKWYEHSLFEEYREKFQSGTKRINAAVDNFMSELGFEHDRENGCYKVVRPNSERIGLFAHEGAGKLIMSSLLDLPYPLVSTRLEFGHSSMTVIWFDETKEKIYPRVLQWSNDSHLFASGVDTKYWNVLDI